jgi:hypothetical protein
MVPAEVTRRQYPIRIPEDHGVFPETNASKLPCRIGGVDDWQTVVRRDRPEAVSKSPPGGLARAAAPVCRCNAASVPRSLFAVAKQALALEEP